jgi:hypothetical protein
MTSRIGLALAGLCCALTLAAIPAQAQSLKVTRSTMADKPFTLIYPDSFGAATGTNGVTLTITHREAPLQCSLIVAPLEGSTWTADNALANFDSASIEAGWQADFPGFAVSGQSLVDFQGTQALLYEGASLGSPNGVPARILHAETVDQERGYIFECIMADEISEEARPLVDFMIGNFATRSDATCCSVPFPTAGLR